MQIFGGCTQAYINDLEAFSWQQHVDGIKVAAMITSSRRTASIAAAIVAAVLAIGVVSCRALDRSHAATMLNIAKLPASAASVDCASYGFTDVLERCAFDIVPTDFDALLRGYQFTEEAPCRIGASCDGHKMRPLTSRSFGGGPVVGRDFVAARYYVATPKEFEHGGNITVLANASRSLVMIDLYIE